MAKQLSEFFITIGRNRGIYLAKKLRDQVLLLISIQAPIRTNRRGRKVALTPAEPGMPPRTVSGDLYRSVKVQETAHGAKLTIYKPYGYFLEKSTKNPHPFLSVAEELLGLRGKHAT